ncbi:unnamed protein product [Phytomonas sp. EM1]|nr:unnamed protein product [Phytomonas sp. EM1]|eukprot:CCW60734.1 unnamed protein product [Phytomonas sp. isolate EM1]
MLPLLAGFELADAVGALRNQDIRRVRGDLRPKQVAIRHAGEVAGVERPHSGDVDHEHRRAEDVAGVKRLKANPIHGHLLMVLHRFDPLDGVMQPLARDEVARAGADAQKVVHHHLIKRLRRARHEDAAFEGGLVAEVRQRPAVVEVEVRDQHHLDRLARDAVEEGQGIEPALRRVVAAVEEDAAAAVAEEHAGAPDLAAAADGHHLHLVNDGGRGRGGDDRRHESQGLRGSIGVGWGR